MNQKKMMSILFLLFFLLCGCSPLSVNGEVESIALLCNKRLEDCTNKYYNENDVIKLFIRAIEKAKKIEGALDYEEEFTMIIKFETAKARKFHLTLRNDRENNGLLLELPNTTQGYSIPVSKADPLRDIIYEDK